MLEHGSDVVAENALRRLLFRRDVGRDLRLWRADLFLRVRLRQQDRAPAARGRHSASSNWKPRCAACANVGHSGGRTNRSDRPWAGWVRVRVAAKLWT